MLTFENQNIEFQQEYVPDIRKEVIGFANADGGTVYVGIRKDGVVLGVSDPDGVMLQIVNSLKDSLAPDIMPFVRVTTIELEEKPVIEIDVTTGTNRPYYLRKRVKAEWRLCKKKKLYTANDRRRHSRDDSSKQRQIL